MEPLQNKSKITVLAGGIGSEKEVSFNSGKCVTKALKAAGCNAVMADVTPNDLTILNNKATDVFFIALHGRFGEDGSLQQILEDKSLIYTGSGPAASQLAFDKLASKKVFSKAGINTPKAIEFNCNTNTDKLTAELSKLANKYVVKPKKEGSSVGVNIVSKPKEVIESARKTLEKFGNCMIEEFVTGRELTVGILDDAALPIIEIQSQAAFYDYYAKYTDEKTKFLFDTIKDSSLAEKIKNTALDCFNSLCCRHFARVDFILSEDEKIFVLEVNTIPGFTEHSLLPMAAARTGLSMSSLCKKIVETALKTNNINIAG